MQFSHTFQAVLDGRKTQTRRIVKPTDIYVKHVVTGEIVAVLRNGRQTYTVGKTYSVQPGRGKKSIGRIRITGIRQEDVREISDADVVAEGFRVSESPSVNRGEFLRTWCAMHDPGTPSCARHVLKTRPAERYQAWVLEFELEAT